jgi:hypothetical protein
LFLSDRKGWGEGDYSQGKRYERSYKKGSHG